VISRGETTKRWGSNWRKRINRRCGRVGGRDVENEEDKWKGEDDCGKDQWGRIRKERNLAVLDKLVEECG